MIVGHLPAGYLVACGTQRLGLDRPVAFGILLGSVLPDIDMLWFAFVDRGEVHHHTYLTHRPILWIAVLAVGFVLGRKWLTGIGIGGVLHMMLDTIAGAIAWGWPLSDAAHPLVVVPATQDHWVLSFLLHWTFLVELAVCAVALAVFAARRRAGNA